MLTQEKLDTLLQALKEIQDLHPEDLDYQINDEWGEAACFRHCQKIATKAIEDVQSTESNDVDVRFRNAYVMNP